MGRLGLEPSTHSLNMVLAARRRADQTIPFPVLAGIPIIVVEPSPNALLRKTKHQELGCGLSAPVDCYPSLTVWGTVGYSDFPAGYGICACRLPGSGPQLKAVALPGELAPQIVKER